MRNEANFRRPHRQSGPLGAKNAKRTQLAPARWKAGAPEAETCETNPIGAGPRQGPSPRRAKDAKRTQFPPASQDVEPLRGPECKTNPISARGGGTGGTDRTKQTQSRPARRKVGAVEGEMCETNPIPRPRRHFLPFQYSMIPVFRPSLRHGQERRTVLIMAAWTDSGTSRRQDKGESHARSRCDERTKAVL
jgi:hypothetical protein